MVSCCYYNHGQHYKKIGLVNSIYKVVIKKLDNALNWVHQNFNIFSKPNKLAHSLENFELFIRGNKLYTGSPSADSAIIFYLKV